jgi:hypothetical protein
MHTMILTFLLPHILNPADSILGVDASVPGLSLSALDVSITMRG